MAPDINRRDVLRGIAASGTAVGMAGLAGCLGDDGIEDETLDIGVIQPLTGVLEYYGEISVMGFASGLAYKYDDLDPLPADEITPGTHELDPDDGPTINLHLQDSEFTPGVAQEIAEDFVLDDEVDILFGTSSSGSARQIIDEVVEPTETPFIAGPAADANITVDEANCNEWTFRASEHTAMDARAGGVYAAEEVDMDQVAIFYADYEFGQSVRDNYREVLEDFDIEVSPVRGVPQEYDEFEGLFDEAVDEGAEAVVGGFTVATLPQFISTAANYDLHMFGAFAELLTTQAMGETIVGALGEDFTAQDVRDAKMGPLTTRYHWNQYDNEINDEFIDMYMDAYGQVPDLFSAGTFVGASALIQAAEQAGSIEPDDIVDEMSGMTVEATPKGEDAYVFQEHNNQAASAMTVTWPVPTSDEWADGWPAAVMPEDPVATFDAEDVMVPADEASCDLS